MQLELSTEALRGVQGIRAYAKELEWCGMGRELPEWNHIDLCNIGCGINLLLDHVTRRIDELEELLEASRDSSREVRLASGETTRVARVDVQEPGQ
jgi:hypothetical protein